MGNLHAQEFAAAVEDGSISLDAALGYHLFTNHYPRLPQGCLEAAKLAIAAIREGAPEREIDIKPFEIGYHKRYGTMVPAFVLAKNWHLEAFCAAPEED